MNPNSKQAAVFCASGIGDGLLMMIAAHRLHHLGYQVITFHDMLSQLSDWFPDHLFSSVPPLTDLEKELASFDLVIAQNDNGILVGRLIELYQKGIIKKLSVFYPTFEPEKHTNLTPVDQRFDSQKPMAENIAKAIARLMNLSNISKNNGMQIPPDVTPNQYANRVVIHPMSKMEQKNWPKDKYLTLAKELKKRGFQPIFVMNSAEKAQWPGSQFSVPEFENLDNAARFIIESGFLIGNDSALGHLASNFHLPTLIISDCEKRMRLWRPGWRHGTVITPWKGIPNIKGLRLRKNYWKQWISVRKVLKTFLTLPSGTWKDSSTC